MKYRRLTTQELQELEAEFIRFLAVQSIPADDWEKIKVSDQNRVEELLEGFSDVVFEKTLNNIEYLEFKTTNDIKTFHCQADKIVMMGLFVEGEAAVDFKTQFSKEMLMELGKNTNAELKLYTAEKGYKDGREAELFKMMEGGCLISKEGELYKTLEALKQ
ncbi:MAG: hypothetical protein ACI9XO_001014 [Paraglaciecola sp.]|jgi:hypothetical protein